MRKLKKEPPHKPIFLGGTPLFGYQKIDQLWAIDKTDSYWVKYIFDTYESGKSTIDIKITLDKEGISPRRTSSGLWNIGTLQSMLRNSSYTGLHQVNEYKTISVDKITKKRTKEVVQTFNYKIPKL